VVEKNVLPPCFHWIGTKTQNNRAAKEPFFMGDERNFTEAISYYPATSSLAWTELEQFCDRKLPADVHKVMRWCENVELLTSRIKKNLKTLHKLSLTVVAPYPGSMTRPELFRAQWARWMPFIYLTATHGSACGWYERLKVPSVFPNTKLGVYAAIVTRKVDPTIMFHNLDSVYDYLRMPDHHKIPIKVIIKDEPVKNKKLLLGRHRSICMPEWTACIVEASVSSFINDTTKEVSSLDTVLPLIGRFSANPIGHWAIGVDLLSELPKLAGLRVIDLDVSGWDKSLPMSVIESMYVGLCSNRNIALNCAHGYNGQGVYLVGDSLVSLPPYAVAWCSGSPKTLSGNSIIHSALLHSLGLDGVVQGDDANIFGRTGYTMSTLPTGGVSIPSQEEVRKGYLEVGLEPKQADLLDEANFCKTNLRGGQVHVDFKAILLKADASLTSYGNFATLLTSLRQLAARTGDDLDLSKYLDRVETD